MASGVVLFRGSRYGGGSYRNFAGRGVRHPLFPKPVVPGFHGTLLVFDGIYFPVCGIAAHIHGGTENDKGTDAFCGFGVFSCSDITTLANSLITLR